MECMHFLAMINGLGHFFKTCTSSFILKSVPHNEMLDNIFDMFWRRAQIGESASCKA